MKFTEGHVFNWGENKKAVIVKVLDDELDKYYCVYHQNTLKYVVAVFTHENNEWHMSDESGRQIRNSEWTRYVNKLKNV